MPRKKNYIQKKRVTIGKRETEAIKRKQRNGKEDEKT